MRLNEKGPARRSRKSLFLLVVLSSAPLWLSSCVTADVIARAKGRPPPRGPQNVPAPPPAPVYYALVPLAMPFDLVFWPVEYFVLRGD